MKTLRGALWLGLWHRNRPLLAVVAALITGLALFNRWCFPAGWIPFEGRGASLLETVHRGGWAMPWENYNIPLLESVAMLLSFLTVFAIFSFVEDLPRKGVSGLAPRLFTLPLKTNQLVFEAVLAGLLGISVCFVLWECLVLHPLHYLWPFWCSVTLLAAAAAGVQAILWSLPSFPRLRLAALATGATVFVDWFLRLRTQPMSGEQETTILLAHVTVFLLFLAVAWGGVTLERHGFWTGRTWAMLDWRAVFDAVILPGRSRSGWFWTQFHQEFRANALGPMLWFIGILALVMMNMEAIQQFTGDREVFRSAVRLGLPTVQPFDAKTLYGFWLPVGAASLLGLRLTRDAASRRYGISPFLATRPLKAGAILLPKIVLAALLVLGFSGICLLCGKAGGYYDPTASHIYVANPAWNERGTQAMVLIIRMPMTVVALTVLVSFSLATLLWPLSFLGWWRGFPWSLLVYSATVLPLVFYVYPNLEHAYPSIVGHAACLTFLRLAWIGKGILACWSLKMALDRGLFNRITVLGLVFGWALIAYGLTVWVFPILPGLWARALILLPLSRFALSALALDHARHRQVSS